MYIISIDKVLGAIREDLNRNSFGLRPEELVDFLDLAIGKKADLLGDLEVLESWASQLFAHAIATFVRSHNEERIVSVRSDHCKVSKPALAGRAREGSVDVIAKYQI